MNAGKIIVLIIGIALLGLGALFLIAAGTANTVSRLLVGALFFVAGGFLLVFGWRIGRSESQPPVVVRQDIELSGDVHLESMKCAQCGGSLSSKDVSVAGGGIFVTCPYCGSHYQVEEEPKW